MVNNVEMLRIPNFEVKVTNAAKADIKGIWSDSLPVESLRQ